MTDLPDTEIKIPYLSEQICIKRCHNVHSTFLRTISFVMGATFIGIFLYAIYREGYLTDVEIATTLWILALITSGAACLIIADISSGYSVSWRKYYISFNTSDNPDTDRANLHNEIEKVKLQIRSYVKDQKNLMTMVEEGEK